jgi:hypothetical protein
LFVGTQFAAVAHTNKGFQLFQLDAVTTQAIACSIRFGVAGIAITIVTTAAVTAER